MPSPAEDCSLEIDGEEGATRVVSNEVVKCCLFCNTLISQNPSRTSRGFCEKAHVCPSFPSFWLEGKTMHRNNEGDCWHLSSSGTSGGSGRAVP